MDSRSTSFALASLFLSVSDHPFLPQRNAQKNLVHVASFGFRLNSTHVLVTKQIFLTTTIFVTIDLSHYALTNAITCVCLFLFYFFFSFHIGVCLFNAYFYYFFFHFFVYLVYELILNK